MNLRTVVRSPAKGEALKSLYPDYADKIELAVVEDMEAPNAYNEVVQGVNVVVHMASPLPGFGKGNEKDILIPAREGVLNMLRAASTSPTVKRVIMTASSTGVVESVSRFPAHLP
jgi:nucleoside-diphosphate-sugar epimerase